jgi:hypothetical protein
MCSYVCNSYNYNQEAFERDLAGIFDHYPSKRQTSRKILQSPRMILWCLNRTNQFWINTIRSVLSMLMLYDEWHLSYTWDNTFTSFLYQRNFPACGFFLLTCLVGLVQPEMENRIYEVFMKSILLLISSNQATRLYRSQSRLLFRSGNTLYILPEI